jgi:hypothetical protein
MLCCACNNATTKPFDQAYQKFSDWVLANSATLHDKNEIDFVEIFGDSYAANSFDLLRYFAKSLRCRSVYAGIAPPKELRQILTDVGRCDTKPLIVTFGINEFWYRIDPTGRIIGDDCFNGWPAITDRQCLSWLITLGYLEIYCWYDLEWEDGYLYGGEPMCGPRSCISLGRHDPLSE